MTSKRVLVPVDFSECSLNALKVAIEYTRRLNGSLLIFNTYLLPAIEGQYGSGIMDGQIGFEEKIEMEKQLRRLTKQFPQLHEITYETLAKPGHKLHESIDTLLITAQIDLIIMGTKGAGNANGFLLGSNANRIVKSVNTPVLLIPEKATLQQVKTIVLASDYKPVTRKTLNPLLLMARLFNAEIHIVHVSQTEKLTPEEASWAIQFEHYFNNVKHTYIPIVNSSIEDSIINYCAENEIDLLALIPRKQVLPDILMLSETRRMVLHSKIPILSLPEKE